MRVTFLNADGAGFGQELQVPDGTTVRELCEEQGVQVSRCVIRVNGEVARGDDELFEGYRVTAAPTQVKGAS